MLIHSEKGETVPFPYLENREIAQAKFPLATRSDKVYQQGSLGQKVVNKIHRGRGRDGYGLGGKRQHSKEAVLVVKHVAQYM